MDGFGRDLFGTFLLGVAILAILATSAVLVVGLAMMFAPMNPGDEKAGALCMTLATLLCGVPGIIGLGASVARLVRERA